MKAESIFHYQDRGIMDRIMPILLNPIDISLLGIYAIICTPESGNKIFKDQSLNTLY
jgi:hypothetical protein